MRFWFVFLFLFVLLEARPQQKLLEQPATLEIVKKGLFYIYNTETEQAEQYIQRVEQSMPQHPVGPMMRALNTNWSANPIEPETAEFRKLIGNLQISLDRTKNFLKQDSDDLEAVFFAMAIYSWLAQFYDEDGHTLKALNSAKKAYHYMKIGFDLLDQSPEFYFSTGLYNYYRVQYPESNPVYKPFVWFFRDGDKQLGLAQLDRASKEAVFTRAEASMYLAHIYLRYENNPEKALIYSGKLVEMFPKNTFFKIINVEALLYAGQFAKSYATIQMLIAEDKEFYRMSGEIFYGIYLEQHLNDPDKARQWYEKSLATGKDLGARADNKKSLAYAGLARIAASNGNVEEARDFYRDALKLAQYDKVKDEAKSYLRDS